ncbi:MAG: isoleucine--tRNA ligase [Nanoarchaeota archaeon]|nr:isoleucine--tRNA ligase [Nanoarchaeota archaeon]
MYDFKKIEEEARKLVSKKDIEKAVSNDKKRKKLFSFLEGPPTANAPPGLHHLEVRTFKDIINKFRYMKGFNVPRKAGWDCHGLPVEVQIEKKLGLNSKKEIEKFGAGKFIKLAKESVFSYIKDWEKSTERIGYWIDLENRYATLDNSYIESVWWSLKQLYEKKLLYEAHKVVPFCPRCETPLSSHEVAQGYEKIKEETVVVKFKSKNEFLLVWTTTPWTLPANIGIAVNEKIDYAYVKKDGFTYIVAKELAEKFFKEPEIIKTVKGKQLVGLEYEPLFQYFKDKKGFRVISGDFVTTEEGTGLVHMAPAFGEVDYDACKMNKLDFIQPVDGTGRFTDEVPDYEGKFIKDTDKEIIARLEDEGKLFKRIMYEHDYPFCWRCKSPLMYYAIKSWFIRVSDYREKLIKLNEKINWTPKHIKEGRFGEWLANAKDWALSRNKFWGTPLPIWRCDCGNEEVIGSIEEMKKQAVKKISDKEIDLHKPWIDSIKLKCKCGKDMSRVSEVIDCWYDSGSASFAQFHYPFENKKEFEKRFPYDFISEAIDQTRGWFYTLHVLGALLFNDVAYKNVICAGHIVDENGEKMSKSKGNMLAPDKVLDEIGVDANRLQFCTVDIGASKRFGINLVREEVLPFLNVLWNTYQFYQQIENSGAGKERIEDRWIISRMNSVLKEATENLNSYQIEKAIYPLMDFVVNDFSKKYIKIIRERDDKNVKKVIGEILDNVSRMLAPYAPNITEVIHHDFGKNSVHLSSWPKADGKKINKKLEEGFKKVMKVIEIGLRERDIAHIGLKWPLASAEITANFNLEDELKEIIARQLNVKKVCIRNSKEKKEIEVRLDTKMTDELEIEGYAREVSRAVQAERKKQGLVKTDSITLLVLTKPEFVSKISLQKKFIADRTGSKKIDISEISDEKKGKLKNILSVKVKDIDFEIYFEKTK